IPFGGSEILLEEFPVLLGGQAVGMLTANINGRAAVPVKRLADVRFAASASTQWFVVKDQLLSELDFGSGNTEPFPLANKHFRLAAVSPCSLSLLAALQVPNEFRLESLFSGDDAAHGGGFGNSGN